MHRKAKSTEDWQDYGIEKMKALSGFLEANFTEERVSLMREIAAQRTRHISVVLEDIYQSHNASAVLRSCDCFGIQDVHIIENRNEWNHHPLVERGSSKWLNIHRYNSSENNSAECLKSLKGQGFTTIATSPHAEMLIDEVPLDKPVALIFGTEMEGISEYVRREADICCSVPMYGFTESFNISVAAAVCLHSLRSRLEQLPDKGSLSPLEREKLFILWTSRSMRHFDEVLERFKEHGGEP